MTLIPCRRCCGAKLRDRNPRCSFPPMAPVAVTGVVSRRISVFISLPESFQVSRLVFQCFFANGSSPRCQRLGPVTSRRLWTRLRCGVLVGQSLCLPSPCSLQVIGNVHSCTTAHNFIAQGLCWLIFFFCSIAVQAAVFPSRIANTVAGQDETEAKEENGSAMLVDSTNPVSFSSGDSLLARLDHRVHSYRFYTCMGHYFMGDYG